LSRIIEIWLAFFAAMLVMAIILPPIYHFGSKLQRTQPAETMDKPVTDNLEVIPEAHSGRANGLLKPLEKGKGHS